MILDLFRGFTGEMSSELEVALENPETDVLFDSFLLEKKERPGLLDLIKTEQTFKDYLSMPVECRAEVEGLRLKDPEFLAGDFERGAPISLSNSPKGLSEKAFFFFKKLYVENSVQRIVSKFVAQQPTSKQGPVSPTYWFSSYDINNGTNLKPIINGQTKSQGIPQGHKFYAAHHQSADKLDGISFDEWVLQQLPAELQEQLKQTAYFQQEKTTINRIVHAYIKHQPTSQKGPVPLTQWFASYDINNGTNLKPKINGKTKRQGASQGSKFYAAYHKSPDKLDRISFDEWVLQQLPPELQEQLKQTAYFQQKTTIEQIVHAYIKHQPTSRLGPVPLTAWFKSYDANHGTNLRLMINGNTKRQGIPQGNKFYAAYQSAENKQGITFDDWILSQLQDDELKAELQSTPYWKEKYG